MCLSKRVGDCLSSSLIVISVPSTIFATLIPLDGSFRDYLFKGGAVTMLGNMAMFGGLTMHRGFRKYFPILKEKSGQIYSVYLVANLVSNIGVSLLPPAYCACVAPVGIGMGIWLCYRYIQDHPELHEQEEDLSNYRSLEDPAGIISSQ